MIYRRWSLLITPPAIVGAVVGATFFYNFFLGGNELFFEKYRERETLPPTKETGSSLVAIHLNKMGWQRERLGISWKLIKVGCPKAYRRKFHGLISGCSGVAKSVFLCGDDH
ncbi:uncharacterized protein LOC143863259 isoform X3 [Tasmannia lanceolata]|uniref:uncharacterized protein LOC143863259 isoform X3 n=1 Tax=Tasmannia lanceolata TaxID=3420 RepID=UPI0040636ED4